MELAQVWRVDDFLTAHPDAVQVDVSWTRRAPEYGSVVYEIPYDNGAPVAFIIYPNGKMDRWY